MDLINGVRFAGSLEGCGSCWICPAVFISEGCVNYRAWFCSHQYFTVDPLLTIGRWGHNPCSSSGSVRRNNHLTAVVCRQRFTWGYLWCEQPMPRTLLQSKCCQVAHWYGCSVGMWDSIVRSIAVWFEWVMDSNSNCMHAIGVCDRCRSQDSCNLLRRGWSGPCLAYWAWRSSDDQCWRLSRFLIDEFSRRVVWASDLCQNQWWWNSCACHCLHLCIGCDFSSGATVKSLRVTGGFLL